MSTANTNKDLVRQFIAVLSRGDLDALDAIVAPNFIRHCQATPEVTVRCLDDFKQFARQSKATFPDEQVEIKQIIAEGDRVAVWCVYTGTQDGQMGPFPPTGKKMTIEFGGVFALRTTSLPSYGSHGTTLRA